MARHDIQPGISDNLNRNYRKFLELSYVEGVDDIIETKQVLIYTTNSHKTTPSQFSVQENLAMENKK